ncbi:diacylglycerol kinase family protein [Paenibacillus sambharensis]|uniref:Diacylglycerol kinase family protein n=1 Tax=Paenibacillus sambharensis TaxID=1803190 RepID=A0A2W1LG67_9BACL|nr:diacylglycerol kinase family protein [Paenibacillus sambharensis]PZD94042.1 diacylglycerol kinase family protein [Paenibacillus sambharensis]
MARLLRSFGYAASGIVSAVRREPNMRIHLAAAGCVTLLGALLGIARLEWALLLLAMGMVVTAELMNTAVERAVDLNTLEPHPLAKAAKDTAAGAVLAAAVFAAVIGAVIFIPHLWRLIT